MSKEIVKDSGLKITVLEEGTGALPQVGQTVLMHYEIWLGKGTTSSDYDYDKKEYVDAIHDSTYDDANPYSGPIEIIIGSSTPKDEVYSTGESIEGLDEALLLMRVGGKVSLFVPSHLAYGNEGASSFHTFHGYRTPPDQSIICNIELVEIKDNLEEKELAQDSGPAYEAL
tara:strand:- start:7724 stop:8236 length:513 start_codon:yes stop_codon:yes gene_type:complete